MSAPHLPLPPTALLLCTQKHKQWANDLFTLSTEAAEAELDGLGSSIGPAHAIAAISAAEGRRRDVLPSGCGSDDDGGSGSAGTPPSAEDGAEPNSNSGAAATAAAAASAACAACAASASLSRRPDGSPRGGHAIYDAPSGALVRLRGGVIAVAHDGLPLMTDGQLADLAEDLAAVSPLSALARDGQGRGIAQTAALEQLEREGHPCLLAAAAAWEASELVAGTTDDGEPLLQQHAPGTTAWAALTPSYIAFKAHPHGSGGSHTCEAGHPGASVSRGGRRGRWDGVKRRGGPMAAALHASRAAWQR